MKSCPFCGGEPEVMECKTTRVGATGVTNTEFWVRCIECRACAQAVKNNRAEAIEAWEMRTYNDD